MAPESLQQFPPHVLREYALLADGERGAVVGPRGEVVWMCLPRWDSTRAACGPPVLYTEEFDVDEHQLRGNLPQAFVHAMMIEAAARLATPTRPRGSNADEHTHNG